MKLQWQLSLVLVLAALAIGTQVGPAVGCTAPGAQSTDCSYTEPSDTGHGTVTRNCKNSAPYTPTGQSSKTTDSKKGGPCGYKDLGMTQDCGSYNYTATKCSN